MKRAPGLAALFTVVAVGMGIPAYYRFKVVDLNEDRDRMLEEAPSVPEARVALWYSHLQPRVLGVLHSCRFSSHQRYLVSHMVAPSSEADPPEVWGVPEEAISPESVILDGMAVRVILPAPTIVDRDVLVGDNALGVEVYPSQTPPEDPRVLLRNRLEFVLGKFMAALEKDIPGASLSIEVGGLVRPRPEAGSTGT